jgi:hypothetical protein
MRKTLLFIHRIVLTLGVVLALTPCGFCQKGMAETSKACSMTHMSGKMDCCHKAKSRSSLCQVMDQSSISVSSVHIDNAAVQTASIEIPALKVAQAALVSSIVPSSSSPPRGPLALRI